MQHWLSRTVNQGEDGRQLTVVGHNWVCESLRGRWPGHCWSIASIWWRNEEEEQLEEEEGRRKGGKMRSRWKSRRRRKGRRRCENREGGRRKKRSSTSAQRGTIYPSEELLINSSSHPR